MIENPLEKYDFKGKIHELIYSELDPLALIFEHLGEFDDFSISPLYLRFIENEFKNHQTINDYLENEFKDGPYFDNWSEFIRLRRKQLEDLPNNLIPIINIIENKKHTIGEIKKIIIPKITSIDTFRWEQNKQLLHYLFSELKTKHFISQETLEENFIKGFTAVDITEPLVIKWMPKTRKNEQLLNPLIYLLEILHINNFIHFYKGAPYQKRIAFVFSDSVGKSIHKKLKDAYDNYRETSRDHYRDSLDLIISDLKKDSLYQNKRR